MWHTRQKEWTRTDPKGTTAKTSILEGKEGSRESEMNRGLEAENKKISRRRWRHWK